MRFSEAPDVFRRVAEAKPMAPTAHKRSARFPWQTHPRRTQCGVGADDGCVTAPNEPRCDPLIAPPAPPSQGTRLRIGGWSRFLLPTFLCGRQRKVGAPRTGGTLINQQENKERPKRQEQGNAAAKGKKNHQPPLYPTGKVAFPLASAALFDTTYTGDSVSPIVTTPLVYFTLDAFPIISTT